MTPELKSLTTEELQAELARRNQPQVTTPTPTPTPLDKPNYAKLAKMCQDYITDVDMRDVDDDDWPHYIFEAAIETVYGKAIWEWIRENTQ